MCARTRVPRCCIINTVPAASRLYVVVTGAPLPANYTCSLFACLHHTLPSRCVGGFPAHAPDLFLRRPDSRKQSFAHSWRCVVCSRRLLYIKSYQPTTANNAVRCGVSGGHAFGRRQPVVVPRMAMWRGHKRSPCFLSSCAPPGVHACALHRLYHPLTSSCPQLS